MRVEGVVKEGFAKSAQLQEYSDVTNCFSDKKTLQANLCKGRLDEVKKDFSKYRYYVGKFIKKFRSNLSTEAISLWREKVTQTEADVKAFEELVGYDALKNEVSQESLEDSQKEQNSSLSWFSILYR